jgi:hypothetical protein
MTLDPNTGIVSATSVAGQGGYAVTIQVADATSNKATATLNFGVYSDSSYGGCQMFPPDSIYNQRADLLPIDTTPSHQIPSGSLGRQLHPDFGQGFYPSPGGIPFMRVPANQPLTTANLSGGGQTDVSGNYSWPYPAYPNVVVEGTALGVLGDDHHILILQTGSNNINGPQTAPCTLYESYNYEAVNTLYNAATKTWMLDAAAHYVLNSNKIAADPDHLDSGAQDSDGIPIVPLLIRYSEVPLNVQHPLRITFPSPTNQWVWPGTGCCGNSGPPQGLLYRLKASVNWQAVCPVSTNPQAATLLQALQQYGAYMSDHGSPGFMQGVPDTRWNDSDLGCIKNFHVSDLEVVDNSALEIDPTSGQTKPWVAPATLPGGTTGTAYSTTLAAVGGNPATRQWTVSAGTLPPGLVLNASSGTISGTPTSSTGSPFNFSITATDTASGQASQPRALSIAVTGAALQSASVKGLSPVASNGATTLYIFQFTDTAGYQALSVVNVLINNVLDGRQACYIAYSVANNVLYLVPDNGTGLLPGLVLNGASSTSNGQCTVNGQGSSASGNGNTLTLTLNISFLSSFAGNQVVYLAARDAVSNSGWVTAGVRAVPGAAVTYPNPLSVSPNAGTLLSQSITFTYQDQSDATNLQTVWGLFNTAIDGRGACYFAYYRPGNQIYLIPDNGDGTQANIFTLTGSNGASNSQCSISATGASAQTSGNTLTLTLPITFKTSFAGSKGVWMAAQTLNGAQTSPWQALGEWNVPGH